MNNERNQFKKADYIQLAERVNNGFPITIAESYIQIQKKAGGIGEAYYWNTLRFDRSKTIRVSPKNLLELKHLLPKKTIMNDFITELIKIYKKANKVK